MIDALDSRCSCIGQQFALNEERTVLSLFLRRFSPHLVEGFNYQPSPYLILRPENGMQIVLESRSPNL
jgi:cytochrome P450